MGSSAEVIEAVRGVGLIGAPTSEANDMWSWPLRPALHLAKEVGARLILADVSTRSIWTTPYGTGQFGADREAPYTDGTVPASRDELALLGRDALIRQLDEAEAIGVEASMWLANDPGIRALDRFLELFPLDVLVTPPLDHPTLADRIRRDEIQSVRGRMKGRILLTAGEDGTLRVDQSSPNE